MSDAPSEVKMEKEYRVVFKEHKIVKDCIACYNVVVDRKRIRAAPWLDIPTGEIWISDWYREFSRYILFHELREIEYRAAGYEPDEAHLLALRDEEREFSGDPEWVKLKHEINVCTEDILLTLPGIGKILAGRIMEHRPYYSLRDLLALRGIGPERFTTLSKSLWCVGDRIN